MKEKQAKFTVTKTIIAVRHLCTSDCTQPSFAGEVQGDNITWPVVFLQFRVNYCPWCGLKLPCVLKDAK